MCVQMACSLCQTVRVVNNALLVLLVSTGCARGARLAKHRAMAASFVKIAPRERSE